MALFNEKGDEVEGALTPDEVAKKIEEGAKEATEKVTTLEAGLTKAKEDLKVLSEKDINFEKVRIQVKTLEEELTGLKGKSEGKDKEVKDTKISAVIKRMAGDDKELIEKIKKEFDGFAGDVATDEEIEGRAKKAFTLATGKSPDENELSGVATGFGTGKAPVTTEGNLGKFDDPAAAEIGRKLGIPDKDMKEHGLI